MRIYSPSDSMSGWSVGSRPGSAQASEHVGNNNASLVRLLRQQQQQHQLMAKNAIFAEYSKAEQHKLLKLRRKGWVDPPKPNIDADLDSEAMQRILSLVNSAAADSKRPLNGVWSRFGKPYEALGKLQDTDLSCKGKHSASRMAREARAAAAAAVTAASTPDGAVKATKLAAPRDSEGGVSKKRQAVNAMLAQLTQNRVVTQAEAEEQLLLCRKSVLQFSTLERREAMFPQV